MKKNVIKIVTPATRRDETPLLIIVRLSRRYRVVVSILLLTYWASNRYLSYAYFLIYAIIC